MLGKGIAVGKKKNFYRLIRKKILKQKNFSLQQKKLILIQ